MFYEPSNFVHFGHIIANYQIDVFQIYFITQAFLQIVFSNTFIGRKLLFLE